MKQAYPETHAGQGEQLRITQAIKLRAGTRPKGYKLYEEGFS